MEARGLGTKSTRANIIQRLYDVKYLKNDPAEPSQLGMAVIDALTNYAPHITSPEMTAEAVRKVAGRCQTESSGGITLETLRDYAMTGVDYISVGALTHQIKSLDMSLKAC
jgi:hypothetical protein